LFVRNTWIRRLVGATALLGVIAWSLPTEAANPLPESNGTLAADIAFLQKGLGKEPQKREIPTLKAVAMLIALNAQNQGGEKMLGLRDAALSVAAAIAKKDFAGAKTAAEGLSSPKAGTDKKALKLHELHGLDLDSVMSSFRKGTVGGLNLEADVRTQAKGVTDVKAAGIIGGRVALIGDYTLLLPPDLGDKAKKDQWAKWSQEMTDLGHDIAKESAKGDKANKADLAKKFKALDVNCNACHTVFRQ
jgi:hypothetical protein